MTSRPTQRVQLVVSPLAGIPGATAYHTSILISGVEYSFSSGAGISRAPGPLSHTPVPGKPRVYDMGSGTRSGRQMITVLGPYFQMGTYDLLRKNCNTFTDVALFYLLGRRLRNDYRALECFGSSMPGLVRAVSAGHYVPNPHSVDFDADILINGLQEAQLASLAPEEGKQLGGQIKNGPGGVDDGSAWGSSAGDVLWGAWRSLWAPCVEKSPAETADIIVSVDDRKTVNVMLEDERLACQLQAEEEDLLRDDELMAHALQEEERRLARRHQAEESARGTPRRSLSGRVE